MVAGGDAVRFDSIDIGFYSYFNDFNKWSIRLGSADFGVVTSFIADKFHVPVPNFSTDVLFGCTLAIYKKAIKIKGTNIFSFDEYNGYYSLDGITRIDEKKAKYRYVFYVYPALSANSILETKFASYDLSKLENRFSFAQLSGFNIGSPADIGLEMDSISIDNKPGDIVAETPITRPNMTIKDIILFYFPDFYIEKFFGKVSNINIGGKDYEYVSDFSSWGKAFFAALKSDEIAISADLLNRFNSNMLVYDNYSFNDNWAIQYALPWVGTSVNRSTGKLDISVRLPALINKDAPNILPCPIQPFVSYYTASYGQSFSIVFPGVELLEV